MTRTRRLATALAGAVLLTVTACGGSSGSPRSGAGSGSTGNTVTIRNFRFQPGTTTVAAGSTVQWTNRDDATHTVTGVDAAGFDSGNLAPGKTYSMTFPTAGTYRYMCSIHDYMQGTITVR